LKNLKIGFSNQFSSLLMVICISASFVGPTPVVNNRNSSI